MPNRWPKHLEDKLTKLVKSGKYTYREIASMMRMNYNQVVTKGQHLGLVNPTYRNRITKHKHLRDRVFKYYIKHGFDRASEHYNLTKSETKSILTVCYKQPHLLKYRRDTRVREPWNHEQTMILIQRLGIRDRLWIAKKTKRSKTSYHTTKEQLNRLGISSKHFHGLPIDHVTRIFGEDLRQYAVKTMAGPKSSTNSFEYKMIPWVTLEILAERHNLDPFWCKAFAVQAKLQRWIYGVKTEQEVRSKIKSILKE